MKRKNSYNYFVIVILAFIIYGQSVTYKFNMDDELVTVGNTRVEKGFDGIKEILDGYYYEDDMGYKYGYRPVSQITFALEYQLFGENPHFSHFVNVCLYILICCLIFYFLSVYIAFPNKFMPLLITLFFLVHPLHVEAVASIKNREELLAFLFPFLGLILSLKAIDTKRWYLFLLVAICNFLAIYSKQSSLALMVSIPFLVVILRQLTVVNLVLLVFAYVPFVVFSLKSSLVINKNFVILFLFSTSIIALNYLYWIKDKFHSFVKNQRGRSNIIIDYVVFFVVIIISIYSAYKENNWYLLLIIFPLLFKNKILKSTLLKISFLFPIYLFSIMNNESWLIILVTLAIYEIDFFNSNIIKLKKEWLFIIIFLTIGVIISITKQKIDFKFLLPIIYMLLILYSIKQTKYKKPVKLYLILFIILYIINISQSIQKNVSFADEFFQLIIAIFVYVKASFKNNIIVTYLNKFTFIGIISLIFTGFYLSDYADFSYSNQILSEFKNLETKELFNEYYQHQNTDYSSRVIDFTENPYFYYKNQSTVNGQSISSALFYLQKITVPYPISSYYGYNILKPVLNPLSQILILFSFVLLGSFLIYFFRNEKLVLWSIILLIISLISISNIFEVIPGIVADRLAFTLVFSFAIILVSFIFKIIKNERINLTLIGIAILIFSLISFLRVQKWETPYKLFSNDVKNFPQSAKLHSLLANTIMKNETTNLNSFNENEVKNAKKFLEEAINIYPNFFNAHYDLARVDEILKLDKEAIEHYNYIIEKDSTFYDAYLSLADLYLQEGNKVKTVANLRKYLQYNGYNIDLYFNLSSLEYWLGNYENVINLNKEVILNNPQVPEAYLNIAYAYGQLGEIEKLKAYLKVGEQLNNQHPDAKKIREQFLQGEH